MARKKTIQVDGNRSKGSGTLVLRGNVWHARWMVNGKLYTRSTKCTDKDEAEKKLAEYVKPFQEETTLEVLENLSAKMRVQEHRIEEAKKDAIIKEEKAIKLAFLIDVYKSDVSANPITASTETNYISKIDALIDFTNKTYAYEITKEDATSFLEMMKTRYCPIAFNQTIVLMKTAFNIAMKKDHRITTNVWEGFSKLKVDKTYQRRELTTDEVNRLIEVAFSPKMKKRRWIGILFMIGRYTGLRRIDCAKLRWKEIDFESNMIRILPIKTKKTGRVAVIPLHPKLREKLLELERVDEYVLPQAAKMIMCTLNSIIKKVFDFAKIDTFVLDEKGKRHTTTGFHSLRTTFVSECARDGIPLPVIQKMVAHSKVDMTMHYARTQESDLRLPDFESVKISIKKSTYELLQKYADGKNIDEVILKLVS